MDIFTYNKLCGASNLPLVNLTNSDYIIKKIKLGGDIKLVDSIEKTFKYTDIKKKLLDYMQKFTKTKVKKIITEMVNQKKSDYYIFNAIKQYYKDFNYKDYIIAKFKKILIKISEFIDLKNKKILTYGYNYLTPELKKLGIDTYAENLQPNSYDIVILNYNYHKIPNNLVLHITDFIKKDTYYYYYKHPELTAHYTRAFQLAKNKFEILVLGFDEPPNKFINGEYEMYFLSGEFIKQRMSGDIALEYGAYHKCNILFEKKNNKRLTIQLLFKCKPSGSILL